MRGKSKWSLLLALVFVLSVFLSACSGGGGGDAAGDQTGDSGEKTENTGNTNEGSGDEGTSEPKMADEQILHLTDTEDIPGLDSSIETDASSFQILHMIHAGLMTRYDEKAVPDMAKSKPKVSEDGTVYTWTLRDDIKWSNGDPVTAKDFVYAWRRTVNPETGSQYAYIYASANIKNAAAIMDKDSEMFGKVEKLGVEAVDEKTLKVTLEKPTPFYVGLMAFPVFYPQHKSVVEKNGEDYATEPSKMLFNGPYIMKEWNHGVGWTLVKNDNYWDAENITMQKVVTKIVKEQATQLKLYKAGKVDIDGLSADRLTANKDSKELHYFKGNCVYNMKLNVAKIPAFQNVKIRQAMSLSLNRKSLTENLLKNGSIPAHWWAPINNFVGPNGNDFISSETPDNPTYYKPEKAKKLWKEGKQAVGFDTLTVELMTTSSPFAAKIAQVQAHNLEALPGLKVEINKQPWGNYLELGRKGQFDIAGGSGWCPDYKDPMTYMDMWVTGGPQNTGKWSNEKYDSLIQAAQKLGAKPEKRWEKLKAAEDLLMHKLPIIPVYQGGSALLIKSNLKGMTFPNYGPSTDYRHAYFVQK